MNGTTTYRHWRLESDDDGISWLTLDMRESSTNVLSDEVLDELDRVLAHVEKEGPRGIVFLSAKKNGFIAGADINEFGSVPDRATAVSLIRRGQMIFDRIEDLPFPTVSLIHGFCLGGGLELSLACDYRVAREDVGTRLGLPEVRLGIHPGFGGSVRLPALIGGLPAMDLMLGGRTLTSRAAKRLGIVDAIAPERQLRAAARSMILKRPPKHKPRWWASLTNLDPARKVLAPILRRKVEARAPKNNYPAPHALIDLWEKDYGHPGTMLPREADSVAGLVTGDTARNLVRVFLLQEQLKSLGRKSEHPVRHVHVVGAGIMGGDIAAWCAAQGLNVSLQDQEPARIAPALKRAHELFKRRLKVPRNIQAAMDRLMPDHKGVGVAQADVVIEAIFEDRAAKQALYKDIEPRLKDDAWLATNTSSILLEELAEGMARPERLVGLHFFNPVAKMQLVEVVHGENSADEVTRRALCFTRQIDRLPLPVKSAPGFLVNRVLMPYLLEAVVLEMEKVPAPVIDRAATDFGMPMGPIELADAVGLDICLYVSEILGEYFGTEVPRRLRTLVESGHLGRKSGQGFYRYHKGKPVKESVKKDYFPPSDLSDRLIMPLLNETAICVDEGIVESADLADAGLVYGAGFAPFRGGPMHYIDARRDRLARTMARLHADHGDRFKPAPALRSGDSGNG